MDKALQIFKKHGAHYYQGDEQAIIDAMHEFANQWISVNDRLPENDFEVLIYCGTDILQAYLKNGFWKGSMNVTDNMNDGYVNDRVICKQGCNFDFVSHWMPLPQPPKSK